ncbi:MAG: hypothetical protein JNL90_16015 [Planctomycetes bacterium]|nr:hypothetical protein [Planctomycetota bacterium]
MPSQDLAPAAPATTPAFRVPAWFYVSLAIAVVPWLAYWIAIDPTSPRWDRITSLFILRGPVVAIVAATVALTLLIGLVRHWNAASSDSAWHEPVLRRGAFFCIALSIGLGTQTSFATALVDHRARRLVAAPSAATPAAAATAAAATDAATTDIVVELLRLESLRRYRIEQARWIGFEGQGRWVRQSEEGPR